MTELLIRTEAIKIVNRGGGYKQRTIVEDKKDGLGINYRRHHHEVVDKREKGGDYVVFCCPWPDCGKRNRQSVYQAKQITAEKTLTFRCWSCRREIEVAKPTEIPTIVIPRMETNVTPGILYGPNDRPIHNEA